MIATIRKQSPVIARRALIFVGDSILFVLALPFIMVGVWAGLLVSVTLWIIAAILAGYAAAREATR